VTTPAAARRPPASPAQAPPPRTFVYTSSHGILTVVDAYESVLSKWKRAFASGTLFTLHVVKPGDLRAYTTLNPNQIVRIEGEPS
jgi:hypothetical protein